MKFLSGLVNQRGNVLLEGSLREHARCIRKYSYMDNLLYEYFPFEWFDDYLKVYRGSNEAMRHRWKTRSNCLEQNIAQVNSENVDMGDADIEFIPDNLRARNLSLLRTPAVCIPDTVLVDEKIFIDAGNKITIPDHLIGKVVWL